MALTEICNSTFNHYKIESIGQKKYFKHRMKDKIICEECLNAYLDEASKTLSWEIFNSISNVDMKSMITTSDIERSDSFSFTYERSLINNFMQSILPIKFKLYISFMYDSIIKYTDTDYMQLNSISAASASPIKVIKIATCRISPIVCDESYPAFSLAIDILEKDTSDSISEHIRKYISSFVSSFFIEIPDIAVQNIMNKKSNGIYTSHCDAASTNANKCSKCNVSVYGETYIYQNNKYCLNCMYEIVVQLAIDNNIPDKVGLSYVDTTTSYGIIDTEAWKRSVIDKYINVMLSFGVTTNIIHYTITCY